MVNYTHFITRQLGNYLLYFNQMNYQTESVIIVWENPRDLLIDLQKIQYRLLSVCGKFCFAGTQTYQFTSTQYNSHSIQYAAVSQPDMNELVFTKFPLPFANEL